MIVSGIPESEAVASAVWTLAAGECRLCQLALMWLAVNRRRVSNGSMSLIEVCRRLKDSDLVPAVKPHGTNDAQEYRLMVEMARSVLLGETVDPTFGAWRAHRHAASPGWSLALSPTALIGPFLFYAPEVEQNGRHSEVMEALA